MAKELEQPLVAVPATAKRARETLLRWGWAEPTVWTERMLAALDEGVKGGHAFFAEHGLFRLSEAHALARQSLTR